MSYRDPSPCVVWKVFWSSNCYRGWDKWLFDELRRGLRAGYRYVEEHGFAWEWWNFYEGFDERYYYGYFPPIHSKRPLGFVDGGVFLVISRNPFVKPYESARWFLVGVYGGVEVLDERQYYGGMVWENIPEEHKRLLNDKARSEIMDNGYHYVRALKEYSTPMPIPMPMNLLEDIGVYSLGTAFFKYLSVEQGLRLLDKALSFIEELRGYRGNRYCISVEEALKRIKNARNILEGYLRGELPSITVSSTRHTVKKTEALGAEARPSTTVSLPRTYSISEKILEDILAEDLSIIEHGLELVSRQYTIPGGRIDILAKDKDNKLVIIEVKSGLADDSTLTQLLSYMSLIEEKEKKPTRGIMIAEDFTRRLILAARKIDSIKPVKIKPRIIIEKVEEY